MGLPTVALGTVKTTLDDISQGFQFFFLEEFDGLLVATLPPMSGAEQLVVGRSPDCDVVLEHPSVSKRHARLRWNDQQGCCSVEDLGSTNGTFLNDSPLTARKTDLRDGDILSFGEVPFWYLLAETFRAKVAPPGDPNPSER